MRKTTPLGQIWRRLLAGATAALVALLFCACFEDGRLPRITTFTTVPGSADTALPRRIVLAVGSDEPEYMIAAAENFCRRANLISGGVFSLDVIKSPNPVADFKSGAADMMLIGGSSAETLHYFFTITNEHFRYGGYEDFSITCNSARILERLSEVSGANVFGAYYTGSDIFVGRKSLDEILNVSRGAEQEEPEQPDDGKREIRIFTAPGSGAWLSSNFPDADVTGIEDPAMRVREQDADTMAELPLKAEPGLSALRLDGELGDEDAWVITRSFHNISPAWLILEPSLYESLPELGRAAMTEASAYMSGDIDGVCLVREQALLDEMEEGGAVISGAFTSTRSRIFRAESARRSEMNAEERKFRELLGMYR